MIFLILGFVSGILTYASRPPWEVSGVVFVSLIPWLYGIHCAKKWHHHFLLTTSFILSYGLLFNSFMIVGSERLLGTSYLLGTFYLILGLPLMYAPFILSSCLLFKFKNQSPFYLFPIVFIHGTFESLLTMTGVFVDTSGYGLYQYFYLQQLAELGPIYPLSVLVLGSNILIYKMIILRSTKLFVWTLSLLILISLASYLRVKSLVAQFEKRPTIEVSIIQGHTRGMIKSDGEIQLNKYIELTNTGLQEHPETDLVVWPESSFNGYFHYSKVGPKVSPLSKSFQQLLNAHDSAFVFNGKQFYEKKNFNTSFLIQEGELSFYQKKLLLPFGEANPFSKEQKMRDLHPGIISHDLLFKTVHGTIRLSPLICFENTTPWRAIKASRDSDNVILSQNNDGWFVGTPMPEFHLILAVFRSIETRRAQILAGEIGHSGFIYPDGSVASLTDIEKAQIVHGKIPVGLKSNTLASLGGAIPVVILLCLSCLIVLKGFFNR